MADPPSVEQLQDRFNIMADWIIDIDRDISEITNEDLGQLTGIVRSLTLAVGALMMAYGGMWEKSFAEGLKSYKEKLSETQNPKEEAYLRGALDVLGALHGWILQGENIRERIDKTLPDSLPGTRVSG